MKFMGNVMKFLDRGATIILVVHNYLLLVVVLPNATPAVG